MLTGVFDATPYNHSLHSLFLVPIFYVYALHKFSCNISFFWLSIELANSEIMKLYVCLIHSLINFYQLN